MKVHVKRYGFSRRDNNGVFFVMDIVSVTWRFKKIPFPVTAIPYLMSSVKLSSQQIDFSKKNSQLTA